MVNFIKKLNVKIYKCYKMALLKDIKMINVDFLMLLMFY